jgi:hypothetical protein
MIASYVAPLAASNTISANGPSRIRPVHTTQRFRRRCGCGDATAFGDEVVVCMLRS